MISPILFIVFNRPEVTKRSFEAIRKAKPPRLYISSDGPRTDRPGEFDLCQSVRKIVQDVDWPCHVYTLFREFNLGPKLAPSEAISWFFANEKEGVILEDDVEALPCFFEYCDEMLAQYRDNPRVGLISGGNLISNLTKNLTHSYFFSRYASIWGWASWARAWNRYDVSMENLSHWKEDGGLKRLSRGNFFVQKFWNSKLEDTKNGKICTWDYQFNFMLWLHNMVAVIPKNNLTLNIGFGEGATHTGEATPDFICKSNPVQLDFPLTHAGNVQLSDVLDGIIEKHIFNISLKSYLRSELSRFRFLRALKKKLGY
jgi:hypothetical protein